MAPIAQIQRSFLLPRIEIALVRCWTGSMLFVVTKGGLKRRRDLDPREEAALRAVAAGSASAEIEAQALALLAQVREDENWIACDCREESGVRPLMAPFRLPGGGG